MRHLHMKTEEGVCARIVNAYANNCWQAGNVRVHDFVAGVTAFEETELKMLLIRATLPIHDSRIDPFLVFRVLSNLSKFGCM